MMKCNTLGRAPGLLHADASGATVAAGAGGAAPLGNRTKTYSKPSATGLPEKYASRINLWQPQPAFCSNVYCIAAQTLTRFGQIRPGFSPLNSKISAI